MAQVSQQLLYEEKTPSARKRHYCLKLVKLVETKATKNEQSVNIQFTRDSKTSVQVDNVEEKKIQEHLDFVASRLQKLHKNMMWNIMTRKKADMVVICPDCGKQFNRRRS